MARESKVGRAIVSIFGLVLIIWGVLLLVARTLRYRLETRLLAALPDYPRMSLYELFLGYVFVVFIILLGLAIFGPFWNLLKSKRNIEIPTKKKVLIILVLIAGLRLSFLLLRDIRGF